MFLTKKAQASSMIINTRGTFFFSSWDLHVENNFSLDSFFQVQVWEATTSLYDWMHGLLSAGMSTRLPGNDDKTKLTTKLACEKQMANITGHPSVTTWFHITRYWIPKGFCLQSLHVLSQSIFWWSKDLLLNLFNFSSKFLPTFLWTRSSKLKKAQEM